MTRTAIYLRISLDQTGEGLGVTRQLQDCEGLARQLGWDIAETYTDNDVSATSGKPRPAYRRMLADLDAGRLDAIIAWHADRLYRKAVDLGELVDVCKRNNTQIATVRAGTIDLTTPTGRLVAGLLAQVATYEGEAKSDRWKRAVRQRREAGTFAPSGPRMYGWTRDGTILPDEADTIRWMAAEITSGGSLNGLANEAHARGILSSNGNTWTATAIRRLLLNPKLAGWQTLNGEIIGTGNWTPILDPEAWEAVRGTLAANQGPANRQRVALLAGLIYCGAPGCGAKMVTGSRMTKTGTTRRTYRCTRVAGQGGCGAVSGPAEKVEAVVEDIARAHLADPATRSRVEALRADPTTNQHELAELELRIQELERQLDEPGVPVETILRAIDRAKEKQENLLREVGASSRVPLPAGDGWPKDLQRRRALIDLVFKRVELKPSTTPGKWDPRRVVPIPR